MAKGLTKKQRKFCNEYLIDFNATQAAIRAGYSEKTANQQAARMLVNVNIRDNISERMKELEKETQITQKMVIEELAAVAFANGTMFEKIVEKQMVITTEDGQRVPVFDDEGNPVMYQTVEHILTEELSEEKKKAIASIKNGKCGIEVMQADKVKALELLGKHLGMFTNKVELEGDIGVTIVDDV